MLGLAMRGWIVTISCTRTSREELFPVLRDLLWQVKIRSSKQATDALQLFEQRTGAQGPECPPGNVNALAVRKMAEICPPFAWRVLHLIRKKRLVRNAIRDLLGLHDSAPLAEGVSTALTPMYRALGDLLGCDMMDVDGLRRIFLAKLEQNDPIDRETEQRFRRLAESACGSRYLAAAVLASSGKVAITASPTFSPVFDFGAVDQFRMDLGRGDMALGSGSEQRLGQDHQIRG